MTRWEFRLHEAGPDMLSGLIVLSGDDAAAALRKYNDFVQTLSEDTAVWAVLRKAPPLPFLPENVHGTNVLVLALCHNGDPEQGMKNIEPLRALRAHNPLLFDLALKRALSRDGGQLSPIVFDTARVFARSATG